MLVCVVDVDGDVSCAGGVYVFCEVRCIDVYCDVYHDVDMVAVVSVCRYVVVCGVGCMYCCGNCDWHACRVDVDGDDGRKVVVAIVVVVMLNGMMVARVVVVVALVVAMMTTCVFVWWW